MKVLQLGKYYYPYMGGMENHLYLLCEQLRERVDLEAVVCNDRPSTVREVVDGVRVVRCHQALNVASTSICPTMPGVLSRIDYDLIHFHFPHPMGVIAYLASRKPRRHAVVITWHSDVVRQKALMRAYAPFMERVIARAAAIICTSPNYIESSPVLRRHRAKCRVIPYGIDLAQFALTPAIEAKAAEIRSRYAAPIALAVGRLIYYKGFEYAVEAMREAEGSLLIIGEGPLSGSLQERARATGVEKRVHFLGDIHNKEIAPYYYASDLFVLPSIARSEAFGIVQLEAMACGRPVINTALDSGVPFASRHGESGLTVEPRNAHALAEAMKAIVSEPERARRLGEAGRLRVEREFSREVMGKAVRSLYEEIASRPGAL